MTPGTTTPTFDDSQVVSLEGDLLTLGRGTDAGNTFAATASYGLAWPGGTGHVGPGSALPGGLAVPGSIVWTAEQRPGCATTSTGALSTTSTTRVGSGCRRW